MTGIAQDFVAGVVDLFAPGFLVRAGQFDFEVFADMDGADALVAHLFEGVLDGLALRIKDGLFWCDDNFRFHFTLDHKFDWFVIDQDKYRPNVPDSQSVLRSPYFPGLALAVDALLAQDSAKVLDVLQANLREPSHAAFVAQLRPH
jgi:hypothetical protein